MNMFQNPIRWHTRSLIVRITNQNFRNSIRVRFASQTKTALSTGFVRIMENLKSPAEISTFWNAVLEKQSWSWKFVQDQNRLCERSRIILPWVPSYMDRFEAAARGAYICFRSAGGKLIIVKRLWTCYMEKALYKFTTLLFTFLTLLPIYGKHPPTPSFLFYSFGILAERYSPRKKMSPFVL